MRDIALTAVIAVLLGLVFRHPVVGAYLWAWLSMMSPHKLTYGFAYNLPFAQLAALVTLIMLIGTKRRQGVPLTPLTAIWLTFFLWMSFTGFFAIAERDAVIERWIFVFKIQFMLVVTMMLVCTIEQLKGLVWVVALSVAFYGIKGGFWTVTTGGGGRVWGPPGGLIQGNNELAVALVMLMPILYWMRQTAPHRWLRHGMTLALFLCGFSILGSQSRGALLALVAMSMLLGAKSRYPVRATVVILLAVAAAVAFMPDSWSGRMETIQTYDQDSSAMSRIWTWNTLWNAAVDRPLVGAGFQADNLTVFGRYAPSGPEWQMFEGQVYVAHSIYFQVLGEHGFVGITLFLALGLTAWFTARRVARQAQPIAALADWLPLLMRMVQVGLVGYAVGGAFLSLAYFDLPYYLLAFIVLGDVLVRRHLAVARSTAAAGAPERSDAERTGPVGAARP